MLDPIEVRDPERDFASPEAKGIAVAISVTTQISQSRSIVMQTYIDRDADLSEHHLLLDKLCKVSGRQEAKSQLEESELNLALEEKQFGQLKEDYVAIEERSQAAWDASRKKGEHRLSPQEQAQKTTAQTNIRRFQDAIAKRKADIAKLKATIADLE
ncbi:MAG: hypothetical protein KGL35_24910 [Bradyrhizobium sp.]|nr:hypothetical protein [Bradyrhizobium sp.]